MIVASDSDKRQQHDGEDECLDKMTPLKRREKEKTNKMFERERESQDLGEELQEDFNLPHSCSHFLSLPRPRK